MAQITPVNRYKKISQSLQDGHNITRVAVPSFHVADDIVVYEVDVSNKKLRWNLWLRYESFYLLHQMMTEITNELDTPDNRVVLPPFPEKRLKLFVDHFNPTFIQTRQMLLENYLQKILMNESVCHCEIFISFLTPPENEEFEVTTADDVEILEDEEKLSELSETPDGKEVTPHQMKPSYEIHNLIGRDLKISNEDEVTRITIPQAQILKNDHTIYQIHVENSNKRQSFSEWTVLKRYGEFFSFDHMLRAAISQERPEALAKLPPLPPKRFKIIVDHLDQTFIEKRRLLLQCYLNRLIHFPSFRQHDLTLNFLGVA